MQVHIITNANRDRYATVLDQMLGARAAHSNVPSDDQHAVHLLAQRGADTAFEGIQTLLPTWRMDVVCEPLPRGPDIWLSTGDVERAPADGPWPDTQRALLLASMEFACSRGVERYATVCDAGFVARLVQLGLSPVPHQFVNDRSTLAISWRVSPRLLVRARRALMQTDPVAIEAPATPSIRLEKPTPRRKAPDLPRVDASISADTAVELLNEHGVLIVENAIDDNLLAQLQDDLSPWFDRAVGGEGQFFGRKTRRFGAIFAKAPSTIQLPIHPLVLPVMERVLMDGGRVCNSIELSATQAIAIEPGEPAQFLHRDEVLWPFPHDFEIMANAMWAIGDFTETNGATRIIPGSHKWARDRKPEPGQALSAHAPAGSVILWLGGTLHGGGSNQSNDLRRGVVTSFKLGWLASQERMLLSMPPHIARTFPERLQRLIGYELHKPNLGWIEGRDPIEWLRGEIGDLAAATDNLTTEQETRISGAFARPEEFSGYLT